MSYPFRVESRTCPDTTKGVSVASKRRCKSQAMTLVRCHRGIRPVLPRGHRLYDVPGGKIYLDVRESSMMLARALGRYEEAKVQALREFLKPGATFIDIGANKGDFTVLAASIVGPSGRVIAIEPAKNNFRWLRRSVEENAIANAECHLIALGSDNYKGILHLATQSGLHSLLSLPGRVKVRSGNRRRTRP